MTKLPVVVGHTSHLRARPDRPHEVTTPTIPAGPVVVSNPWQVVTRSCHHSTCAYMTRRHDPQGLPQVATWPEKSPARLCDQMGCGLPRRCGFNPHSIPHVGDLPGGSSEAFTMATFNGTPDPSERPAHSCAVAVPFVRFVPFPVPFLFGLSFHPLDCTPCDALRRSPDPSPGPSSSTMAFDPRTHRGRACVGAGTRIYPHGSTHTGEAERVSPCDRRDVAVHASTHTYNVLALTSAHTISLTKQIPILPTYG